MVLSWSIKLRLNKVG